jgi:hypothetical protein
LDSLGVAECAFSRQFLLDANHQPARIRCLLEDDASQLGQIGPKKTRPRAEYDAHAALSCPDIKIGSRHPVNALSPRITRASVIHFTIGLKKFRERLGARAGTYRRAPDYEFAVRLAPKKLGGVSRCLARISLRRASL